MQKPGNNQGQPRPRSNNNMESGVVDLDGYPFELCINFTYYNNRSMPGFNWLWNISMAVDKYQLHINTTSHLKNNKIRE